MTVKSWLGVGFAAVLFALFGVYLVKVGAPTAVVGLIFGGGLLFCGLLIDPAEFRSVLPTLRGKPPAPPALPGSTDPAHPNTEGTP